MIKTNLQYWNRKTAFDVEKYNETFIDRYHRKGDKKVNETAFEIQKFWK